MRHDFDADVALPGVSGRDHRLVKEYVQGIMRGKRWLDFLIAAYYKGAYEDMEMTLKWVLRLGVYDLLYLRTPSHAAIHETVELAKHLVRPGAAGLVNGILRTVDRNREALPQPDTADPVKDLGIRFSHPDWLVRRWMGRFGDDVEHLLAWNNRRPAFTLRVNTQKISKEEFLQKLTEKEIEWSEANMLDDFVRVQRMQPIVNESFLSRGLCSVQDESAGLVVRLVDPKPDETIVDACAAPGGKTLYMAARMQGMGSLWAFDVQEKRLNKLKSVQSAFDASWIDVKAGDLRVIEPPFQVDRMLLDVPCTGLGVLSKRADLRWNRQPEDIQHIASLQHALLEAAAKWVKVDGVLVYSTCTMEKEENEDQIEAFLAAHPNFRVDTPGDLPSDVITAEGYLATIPHVHDMDGAFGARLKRVS